MPTLLDASAMQTSCPFGDTRWLQRYSVFRPWCDSVAVACLDSARPTEASTIEHIASRFTWASNSSEVSDADIVLAWNCLGAPDTSGKFLDSISRFGGRIVLGADSSQWTWESFTMAIAQAFPGRPLVFGSQSSEYPYRCEARQCPDAKTMIACIGTVFDTNFAFPEWPRVGFAMPTVDNAAMAVAAIQAFEQTYPGLCEFAVVANGSSPETVEALQTLEGRSPSIHLVINKKNQGYGRGANLGLDFLWQEAHFDFYCVVNDDVIPAIDCLSQMVTAFGQLESLGHKPGLMGPVTNRIWGVQEVEIGAYSGPKEMVQKAIQYHAEHHSSASLVEQVRGLMLLIHPDCLSDIGGFDPIFGLGNFEDDDYNIRARVAGYSLWKADGAFLHHEGSTTFNALAIEPDGNRIRNLALFLEKWGCEDYEEAFKINSSEGSPFITLGAKVPSSPHLITINGEPVDLVHQASEFELAAWIVTVLRDKPREDRRAVLDALGKVA